jgi:hypothetical protein
MVQLLDIEWLLSTLFDASLLTLEPPATAAPFLVCPNSGQSFSASPPLTMFSAHARPDRAGIRSHGNSSNEMPSDGQSVSARQLCRNLRIKGAGQRPIRRAMLLPIAGRVRRVGARKNFSSVGA